MVGRGPPEVGRHIEGAGLAGAGLDMQRCRKWEDPALGSQWYVWYPWWLRSQLLLEHGWVLLSQPF